MILSTISQGLIPYLTNQIIENITVNLDYLFIFIIVILGLNLSSFIFNYIVLSNINQVVYEVCYNLRRDSNKSVLMQDLSFFDKYATGKIVSRINSDGQKFGRAVILFIEAMSSIFLFTIVITFMLIVDVLISLVFIFSIPLIFVFALSFRKVLREKMRLGQRSLAQVNSFIQESMAGIQLIKTFQQEEAQISEFSRINQQSFRVNMGRALIQNVLFPGLNLILGMIFGLIIYFGGNGIIMGIISAADLYLFFQSSLIIFQPIFQLANFWPQFQEGLAAGERIFSLIDSKSNIKSGNYISKKIKGKIEFNNLNFAYEPKNPIFQNFNLKILPGESIAIVGHTGAGKTSLARLLLRLYEFQSDDNSLKIDDVSIRDYDLEKYRNQVGYIPQVPFLWDDTIENNVKYGSPDTTRKDVIFALEKAGGMEWVENLDDGLDTRIMERGKLLSVGQRQLVAFARVLLQNPSILILDEATASIDPFTETKIREATEEAMEGRTTIIIAHRLVTIRHVDRIIALDHGKIIEQGNHEELIEKEGYYAELYDTYFRHQSYDFLEEIEQNKD